MSNWRNKKLRESAKHESCVSCGADDGKHLHKTCLNCNKSFKIPKCRDFREHCCSSECKKEYREQNTKARKLSRERNCILCGTVFYPRQTQIDNGDGKYCSNKCQVKAMIVSAHTKEANKKRTISFMKTMNGKYKKGDAHVQWTGGKKAAYERYKQKRIENPEYYREKRRGYILNNPDKAREWAKSRSRRKLGRLPRGTVKSIFEMQKGCCAICKIKVDNSYHVDHIVPLARGGLHEKDNIQILCATCNTTKSAKDPIQYMQERGFLL